MNERNESVALSVASAAVKIPYSVAWRAVTGGLVPATRGVRCWLIRPSDLAKFARKSRRKARTK